MLGAYTRAFLPSTLTKNMKFLAINAWAVWARGAAIGGSTFLLPPATGETPIAIIRRRWGSSEGWVWRLSDEVVAIEQGALGRHCGGCC